MNPHFVAIPENLTIKKAIEVVREQDPPESEISFYIFIVDDDNKLVGYTTLRDILMATDEKKVEEIRNDYPIRVPVDMDQEEVARVIRKYDVAVIPVVDKTEHIVGIVTVDDIVDVVVEEATEDIYKLSGTSDVEEEKLLSGKIHLAVRSRIPWLLLTIVGGFVASSIINYYSGIFEAHFFSLALSLSFLPLLMGLGGECGESVCDDYCAGTFYRSRGY